jgi:hypothetical protein
MHVTYDGKFVLAIFSGFQRLEGGTFIFTQDTLEPPVWGSSALQQYRLRPKWSYVHALGTKRFLGYRTILSKSCSDP